MQQPVQTVRTYRTSRAMQRDQQRMMRDGWYVVNTVHNQPRSSLLRLILIGWIFHPKPEIIVTYQRGPAMPMYAMPVPQQMPQAAYYMPQPQPQPLPPPVRPPTLKEAIEDAKRKRKERFGF